MFVVCWVGSGLCGGLIARSEEPYRVCVCLSNFVGDLEISTKWRPRPELEWNKENITTDLVQSAKHLYFTFISERSY